MLPGELWICLAVLALGVLGWNIPGDGPGHAACWLALASRNGPLPFRTLFQEHRPLNRNTPRLVALVEQVEARIDERITGSGASSSGLMNPTPAPPHLAGVPRRASR
jgi:hypothetical protein